MARILVLEQRARGRVAALLRGEGFEVQATNATLATVERLLASFAPQMVVVETASLDSETLHLVAALTATCAAPVLVLCEACDENDVLAAYRAGVSVVLADTTGSRELVARTRAFLRRGATAPEETGDVLSVGPIVLDRAYRQLTVHGRPIAVPRREFEIAEVLMRRAGAVVTRRQLLVELWGASARDSKSLDVQVGRLRARLAAVEGWRRILTVRGVGYRLITDDDLRRGVLTPPEVAANGR